jgi:hypothetical protein
MEMVHMYHGKLKFEKQEFKIRLGKFMQYRRKEPESKRNNRRMRELLTFIPNNISYPNFRIN